MDGDKASALDVYLRFKLSPRFCAAGGKEVLSFADFSWLLSSRLIFSTKEDQEIQALLYFYS